MHIDTLRTQVRRPGVSIVDFVLYHRNSWFSFVVRSFRMYFSATSIMLHFISAGYTISVLVSYGVKLCRKCKERENLCSIEPRTFKSVYTIQARGVPADAHTDSGLYGLKRPGINH